MSTASGTPDLNGRTTHDSNLVYEWLLRFGGEAEKERVSVRHDNAVQRGVPLPKLAGKVCTYQRLVRVASESSTRISSEYLGKHAATLSCECLFAN